uniref:D-isomer specific 2-hydroxyacid dehydrogenase NAD-binding domain-containing protein n=1 Tax=Corethron hystrix TaxID=216773 RepID=A0A7S1G323_9STRA
MASPRPLSTKRSSPPAAIFLNASRLNYDGALDFGRLSSLTALTLHPVDCARDPAEILSLVSSTRAEIVITKEMELPASVLRRFGPHVRLLCEAGTGYNNLPVSVAREEKNVDVCNVPEYSTEAVAHCAVTYLMNFSMSMFQQQAALQRGDRSNFTDKVSVPLTELGGKTLGLVGGAGRIGSCVAEVALALGMEVAISSRKGRLPEGHRLAGRERVRVVGKVDDLLPVSDYVSIHCPLNDETRGSFGREQLEKMKRSAFLINTARGAILNEEELVECMREGVIAGAGLDTQSSEPPPPESGLWSLPNVWMTPHTGWRRIETRQRLIDQTADNIEAYINTGKATNVVN